MLFFLTFAALLIILAVLFGGLWTMMRGDNPRQSQKWMRARVIAQASLLLLLLLSACLLGT